MLLLAPCGRSAAISIRSHTINKTSRMANRPEFLSVLCRVGFSLSNGILPSLYFKPLQVKCFESFLQDQDVIGVLPNRFGKSMLFHDRIPMGARDFSSGPKMCRPSANTKNFRRTREKPFVPRVTTAPFSPRSGRTTKVALTCKSN